MTNQIVMAACVLVGIAGAQTNSQDRSLRIPPKSPKEALRSFQLHPDFRIELVASEPLIRDPVAVAFDPAGQMYVVEFPEFNHYSFPPGVKPKGSVKLLRDTNGDGHFDKALPFLTDVAFPTAVACYAGGVFVGAAPDLLYCKDTNGDGRADERRVVLTGFERDFAGGGLLNSFHWGWDNRLHIATSFAGGRIRRPKQPVSEAVSIRNRGVLWDPRSESFQLTSGGGQHGQGVDDWGRKFLCSNVFPMQQLAYDARYIERNKLMSAPAASVDINADGDRSRLFRISPLEKWRSERSRRVAVANPADEGAQAGGRFTSSSGITIYRGDAWPATFRGNMFVGEVTNNLVYRAKLAAKGHLQVAQRADKGREFLASRDVWFRPVQFANAPDGHLYIVDMYRELIEGAAFVPRDVLKNLDASSGIDRGRIYRLVPKQMTRQPRSAPKLSKKATLQTLVALLDHPNGWHQDTAARLLYERKDERAVPLLADLLRTSQRALTRMRCLYALDGLDRLTSDQVTQALRDPDPLLRMHAIRLAERMADDSSEIRAAMFRLADDENLRVRLQLAYSLGEVKKNSRYVALAQLVRRDVGNTWMNLAVQSSVSHGAGDLFQRLVANAEFRRDPRARPLLVALARQIGEQDRPGDWGLFLRALDSLEQELNDALFVALMSSAKGKLKTLTSPGLAPARRLLETLTSRAFAKATDAELTLSERIEAVRLLALLPPSEKVIKVWRQLLRPQQPLAMQNAVLSALERTTAKQTPQLIIQAWPFFSPRLRVTATETLLSTRQWTKELLAAVKAGKIMRQDINLTRFELLAKDDDAEIRKLAKSLVGSRQLASRDTVVQRYRAALTRRGDPVRGRQVFKKNCATCHRLGNQGRRIGADLMSLRQRDGATVLLHILDPNRSVKPQFLSFTLRLNNGRIVAGMIVEESANNLVVQRADGARTNVLRQQLQSIQSSAKSFMPEGLEKQIDIQAMADLLALIQQGGLP